jgi:hypothetical protein
VSFLASFGKLKQIHASKAQVTIRLTESNILLLCGGGARIFGKDTELQGSATAIATFMILLCTRYTLP